MWAEQIKDHSSGESKSADDSVIIMGSIYVHCNRTDYFTSKKIDRNNQCFPNLHPGTSFGNEILKLNTVYLIFVSGLHFALCALSAW